jgi:hypothetical protein
MEAYGFGASVVRESREGGSLVPGIRRGAPMPVIVEQFPAKVEAGPIGIEIEPDRRCPAGADPLESKDVGANAGQRVDVDLVGLCLLCVHSKVIRSDRGSTFYLCRVSATDSRFPKYPPLPVRSCTRYEARQ